MDLGVTLPTSGPSASPEAIARMAREAEEFGYAAVWTYERLLYALGDVAQAGGPPRPLPDFYRTTYEPIETLAYVCAMTRTVTLGTSVLGALFHVPVVLARRLATLDRFSGGRVVAGLGQGWIPQEFATANVPVKRRGRGFEEFVAALRAAWGPDPVEFSGRCYRIPASAINPKPVRPEGIPILIGALAPAAIERAARIGDGLNTMASSPQRLRATVDRFRAHAAAAGRDPASLRIVVRANTPITDTAMGAGRPFLGGSPAQIAEDLRRAEDLGVDHVLFGNLAEPPVFDDYLRQLERLRVAAEPVLATPAGVGSGPA